MYIPFNCIFFERLIASFRVAGNVGFLIYVADSFGYLGSVGVLITKEVLKIKLQWTSFYAHGVIVLSVFGIAGAIFSLLYFAAKNRVLNPEETLKPLYATRSLRRLYSELIFSSVNQKTASYRHLLRLQ